MEIIFQHQLTHQRLITGAIGRGRRSWKHWQSWYPGEQRRLYAEMDRVYRETRAHFGEPLFAELAEERKPALRLYARPAGSNVDLAHLARLRRVETSNGVYGRLPQYKYEVCDRRRAVR